MLRYLNLFFWFGVLSGVQCLHAADNSPVDLANPLVGTAGLDQQKWIGNAPPPGEQLYTGFVWPGPRLPHRDVLLNPINQDLDLANEGHGIVFPYTHARPTMIGFSSMFPGLMLMPLVGDWTTPPQWTAAVYDKKSETASPGYYSVYFPDDDVRTELTTTEHTGFYRFTFPGSDRSTVLMDLGTGYNHIQIIGDNTIGGWHGHRHGECFVAEFSRPFKSFGTFHQDTPVLDGARVHRNDDVSPDSRSDEGNYAGCYLDFSTTNGEQVLVKIATGRSVEDARSKLDSENPAWDFDGVVAQDRAIWAKKLDLIQIQGGTDHERRFFYSAYYHCFDSPELLAKRGQSYWGRDNQMHVADCDRYSPIPFWDTGRDQITLLMLLEPGVITNVLQTQLEMAQEWGYMDTSFHGDNAVFLYLGAWERGYHFDWGAVYPFLRRNAMDPAGPRGHLADYLKQGWIPDFIVPNPSPPYADGNAGVATTLEYSWDDYDLALYAKKLGFEDDYRMFLARAHNYTNVFDPSIGFMRGRTEDGSWITPFDPREPYYNFMMKEANGWQTLWLVPQDVQGLVNLLGGREKFCEKLDEFFSLPYHPKGIARDVTGMLGQYCQGNQPDRQTPYFYDYAGQPWKTQAIVRKILTDLYGSDKAGLAYPGMDDQGSTSSWYVLGALGFFSTNPGLPVYLIGSPLFSRAIIHMGNGKDLVIIAHNNSPENCYIQSATMNGRPWNKPWFSQSDIANGARLEFVMGPKPNMNWGSALDAAPPSMSSAL